MNVLKSNIRARNRAASEARIQIHGGGAGLPSVLGVAAALAKPEPTDVKVDAETVFLAADQMMTKGPEAEEFRTKTAELRKLVNSPVSTGPKSSPPGRGEITAGVAAEAPEALPPRLPSSLAFYGFAFSAEKMATYMHSENIRRFIQDHFSASQLTSGPAASTEAVQAVKAEVEAKTLEQQKREEKRTEARTFADATGLAARVNNLRELALEMDGKSSDLDGAKDGAVTINSPHRKHWWHSVTDRLLLTDSQTLEGGRIEVGQDGDKSWTLTPMGDSYSAGGETLFVEGEVGYKLSGDGAQKFEDQTLEQQLKTMGFQNEKREHLPHYRRSTVVGNILHHEAEKSGLDQNFHEALSEMEYGY